MPVCYMLLLLLLLIPSPQCDDCRIRVGFVGVTTDILFYSVPDFYGEKISSVAGYRQWLKDQRAFNKKRTSFV